MPKKIRIAYVINDVLYGGAQVALLNIAKRLDPTRFEAIVYYLNEYRAERSNLRSAFEQGGVKLVYIGSGGKTDLRAAGAVLRRRFREWKPDIIHTHLVDASLAGIWAARTSGIRRVVVHEHQTHRLYSWKVRLLYLLARPFITLTVCFSPVVESELFGSAHLLSGLPAAPLRRHYSIYNGVDTEKADAVEEGDASALKRSFGFPADALVITTVARLIEWKGQRTLLEAFATIAPHVPAAHLCLVGEGPLRTELEGRAAALGISERVHFMGAREDVYEILAASDIGALALTYDDSMNGETIGIAGFEMMASGLPLIVSRYPEAAAMVTDRMNAILVPPKDTDALARTLTELLASPVERKRIGEEARAFIRRTMSWKLIIPMYERLYSLLIP